MVRSIAEDVSSRFSAATIRIRLIVYAISLVSIFGVAGSSRAHGDPLRAPRQVAGAGDWQSSRDGQGKRQWQLQLKRGSDGSLGGRIHVVGSHDVRDARIEGRVEEGGVYGVLVGDRDVQIGTFTGAVTTTGAAGTYTFKSGDTGNWNWDDPGAARELKGEAQ